MHVTISSLMLFSSICFSSANSSTTTYNFPKTLHEFGYQFNSDGELRKIDPETGKVGTEKFQFVVKEDDRRYNQKHYEALGDVITEYVYKLLDTMKLTRFPVPVDAKPQEPQTFFFATPKALDEDKPLLVLVHGSGAVQAGQWSRSLIINDSLKTGTQIPYIKKAIALGYGVLVVNTNDNFREVKRRELPIRGSSSPEEHLFQVWDHYILPSKVQKVAFVAHSYGGLVTAYLAWNRLPDFKKKVFAVAMTDSVHYGCQTENEREDEAKKHLCTISRNWQSSDEPLDTPLESKYPEDIACVSAGHNKHEMTSASAINSVFAFLEERRLGGSAAAPKIAVANLVQISDGDNNETPNVAVKKAKTDEEVVTQHQEL